MNGASVKKVILMFFSGNDPICHSQKFQPWQTPPLHIFFTISPIFLTNIRCWYFSLNIWVLYKQLELDWYMFNQNWAKTGPLHFQIFHIPNAIDRPIVHWSKRKSTQASGTLLSLVQSQSSGCTAVSLGLGLSFFIFLGIFNTAFARSKKSLNPILNSADTFVANMRDRSLVTNVFGHCLWHLLVWCIWLPNN